MRQACHHADIHFVVQTIDRYISQGEDHCQQETAPWLRSGLAAGGRVDRQTAARAAAGGSHNLPEIVCAVQKHPGAPPAAGERERGASSPLFVYYSPSPKVAPGPIFALFPVAGAMAYVKVVKSSACEPPCCRHDATPMLPVLKSPVCAVCRLQPVPGGRWGRAGRNRGMEPQRWGVGGGYRGCRGQPCTADN